MNRATIASWLAIALLTLALMTPALLRPPMTHDSFWIDISWADQFTAEMRRGILWPRWLPQSHGGLGAPVFYFYPPLAFWITGLFGLAGLATWPSLLAAFATLLAASGGAMYLWLRDLGARALPGALLYMALPYHLFDFYRRGALAEFASFAVLPLVALALRRAADGRGFGWLAASYAALVLTHLPMALLASLFLVAPLAVHHIIERRAALVPIGLGLVAGLGLSAAYLVPALSLQHAVAIDQLWAMGQYQAGRWSIWHPGQWASPAGMQLTLTLAGVLAIAAIIALPGRGRFWSLLALTILAIVLGVVPGVWSLPLLAKAQFPWRALAVVEFALVTALAMAPLRPLVLAVATTPALFLSALFLKPVALPDLLTVTDILARHHDVPEYLPAGAPADHFWYSKWALDLAARQPPRMTAHGITTVRRFDFPAWQVRCGGGIVARFPARETRLLSWRGENCSVTRITTGPEWIGRALSALTLIALVARLGVGQRQRG